MNHRQMIDAFNAIRMQTKRGVFLYHFSDFETVKALPDVTTVIELSRAIGLSPSRTYELLDQKKIPYLQLLSRKVLFKEHLLQGLSGKRIFTDVSKLHTIEPLPDVFCPKALISALRISNGLAYDIVRTPGFPAVFERNRILISKHGFIGWIRANERNIRKE